MELIRLILNIVWFITAGLWLAIMYVIFGLVACLPIITIPFGVASFRLAKFVIWPFGREAVETDIPTGIAAAGNIIWFIVAGVWLAIGHIATAAAQAVTIIGLPLAWANLKLIPVTCFPYGKRIVNSEDEQARLLGLSRR